MYYSEKNLVVDDLLYLVNSNGKMTSPKKISENNRIMQPRKLAEEQLYRFKRSFRTCHAADVKGLCESGYGCVVLRP